jgi:hypothetical protein
MDSKSILHSFIQKIKRENALQKKVIEKDYTYDRREWF